MILVGIIPGPNEPSLNINSYLTPLVLELQQFYKGVLVDSYASKVKIQLALVGVMCDLPASRKVCGFCFYNALHGCNKCMKEFPTESFGESPNYSGYDLSLWPTRDIIVHRQKSHEYINEQCNEQE